MPKVSEFYGIVIYFNPRDHLPPHFHADYGEHEVAVNIETGAIMAGSLPPRAWRMVKEWFELHRAEVAEDWQRVRQGQQPFQIEPL